MGTAESKDTAGSTKRNSKTNISNSNNTNKKEAEVDEEGGEPVLLNVYNTEDKLANTPGFGIYHSGVEIYGAGKLNYIIYRTSIPPSNQMIPLIV